LHAENIHIYDNGGRAFVRFDVPADNERLKASHCDLPLHGERRVKNTGGTTETRLVIETEIRLGDTRWRAQITLSDRTDMGVPMLLGRATIRGRFLVNPGRSFLQSDINLAQKAKPT
ncbi:MAG: RimK/LysX family protein, partial [Aestuariivirgaceae bacterium]|nr:RimK/LysX family protein [Aestuariivirgaceae bacterium]